MGLPPLALERILPEKWRFKPATRGGPGQSCVPGYIRGIHGQVVALGGVLAPHFLGHASTRANQVNRARSLPGRDVST